MFPSALRQLINDATPKMNPDICNGLAVKHLKYVEEYIDSIFRSVAAGFPPGLTYDGCRRCSPEEEYALTTKKKVSRCVFDVARSDIYLMEYRFSWHGKPLPTKYLYLPFVNDAGVIYVSGSRFVISPILADRVISIGIANVFVKLIKAKITFNRTPHHFLANGQRESIQVAWSDIYNEKSNPNAPKATVKANCTLAHYLFCKYGFKETFLKFAGIEPVIGYDEINTETYPSSEWMICESVKIKPKGFGKLFYEPTSVRIAVRHEHYTGFVKSLIAGFFYCADHFPQRIRAEYVNHTRLWMVLLGHIIWSGNISEGKLHSDITDHIQSLDEYVDNIVKIKLREIGYNIDNIYELFGLIINNFNDWLLQSDDRVNTSYDKELSILYYICFDISSAIIKLYFKLKAASKKEINENKINKIMTLILKPGLIYKITREHGEVSTTSTSGDNKALKTTLLVVPQSNSNRGKNKKDRMAINDPAKRLHASLAEVNAFFNTPKSDPSGRSRLSLYLGVTESGLIVRNEKFKQLIDDTQQLFRR